MFTIIVVIKLERSSEYIRWYRFVLRQRSSLTTPSAVVAQTASRPPAGECPWLTTTPESGLHNRCARSRKAATCYGVVVYQEKDLVLHNRFSEALNRAVVNARECHREPRYGASQPLADRDPSQDSIGRLLRPNQVVKEQTTAQRAAANAPRSLERPRGVVSENDTKLLTSCQ